MGTLENLRVQHRAPEALALKCLELEQAVQKLVAESQAQANTLAQLQTSQQQLNERWQTSMNAALQAMKLECDAKLERFDHYLNPKSRPGLTAMMAIGTALTSIGCLIANGWRGASKHFESQRAARVAATQKRELERKSTLRTSPKAPVLPPPVLYYYWVQPPSIPNKD